MADRTLTVNGQPFTFNRDRFAGVRTMTVTVDELPLTDATTSIKVTVAGHSDISGIYTGTTVAGATWIQQGGVASISASGFNETDGYEYLLQDGDSDPQILLNTGAGFTDRPWKAVIPSAVKITGIAGTETITVDRTASVIDSDRKGESRPLLSKVVGGAAAAYSLRDLNDKAGNNKVVRVRRASDNNERDFLAKEVSNGTLKNWVNTQTVLPLDIQALTDDGRTGSVIPAKAAYSLRNLSKNYTGNVVDVRRSSDDTVQGFTAAQVADGTLLAFVSEPQVGWDIQATFNDSTATITSASSTATTSTVSFTGSGVTRVLPKSNYVLAEAGDQVVFNMSVSGLDSAMTFRLRKASSNTTVGTATVNNGDNQDVTLNLTASSGYTGGYPHFTADAGSGEATVTINSVTVTGKTGFVSKWYDQSGEDNHAVQGTPEGQPKIVNAGSFLNELDFDGTDDNFELTSVLGMTSAGSIFSVAESGGGTDNIIIDNRDASGDGLRLFRGSSQLKLNWKAVTRANGSLSSNTKFIGFGGHSGSSVTVGVNGGDAATSDSNTISVTSKAHIGARSFSSATSFWDGTMNEIIIYDSDQTDNRGAIEANIGEAYSITGIPAYDNTVDGFVETWYDQSGNGNDAVQATAGNQPKIVNAGSLVEDTNGHPEIKFDGSDTSLLKATFTQGDLAQANTIFTVAKLDVVADINRKIYDGGGEFVKRNMLFLSTNGSGEFGFFADDVISTGVTATTDKNLFSALYNGASSELFINGSSSVSGDAGGYPMDGLRIGENYSAGANNWLGQIQEIIIYNSDQSANRPAIEANINNQYDIY